MPQCRRAPRRAALGRAVLARAAGPGPAPRRGSRRGPRRVGAGAAGEDWRETLGQNRGRVLESATRREFTLEGQKRFVQLQRQLLEQDCDVEVSNALFPTYMAFLRMGLGEAHLRQMAKLGLLRIDPSEVKVRCVKLRGLLGSDQAFLKALRQAPTLLRLTEGTFRAKEAFFLEELAFTGEDFKRIVQKRPEVLLKSTGSYEATLSFLTNELRMAKAEVLLTLRREPILLSRNVESLGENLAFLQELGLSVEDVKGAAIQFPNILRYTIANMEEKLEVLEDYGVNDAGIRDVLRKHPFVVSLSRATLEDKISFFVDEQGWELADVLKYRKCFTYSLHRRLRPRLRFAKMNGVALQTKVAWMDCNDQQFAKMLGTSADAYRAFLETYAPARV